MRQPLLSSRNGAVLLLFLVIFPSNLKSHDLEEGSHYTNTWAVEFHVKLSDEEVTALAHEHGFINIGKILPGANFYEFQHQRVTKRSTEHAAEHTDRLASHRHVRSAEQQIGKVRSKRAHIPEPDVRLSDPLWPQTWYLKRGVNSRSAFDMNVVHAWKKGYTGKNVVVTILDDGIERDHPDLAANYWAEASYDINNNDNDPMPRYDYTNENRHGTRCAGEVAAVANNSHCSVGVAYDAKIGGIRMLDGSVTDVVESRSLGYNQQKIDIYSSSWGPDDNGRTVDGPGKLAKQAFIDGVEKGRNGKGNIFMWASGNGGIHHDSCSCDGYTNSIYTLSVSSAAESNTPPWYLEQCASTLASTYSSGANFREKQIVTTDLRKLCTTTHTGTSASAPLAAGLVAVMLEANPILTWRDVQYIVLAAANPEPVLAHGDFKTNGVGRKYSHKFGYGLMDCAKMADMAVEWRTAPPQLIKKMPKVSPDADLRSTYTRTIEVPACPENDLGCIRHLEHVQLVLTLHSSRRGKLSVKVTSPSGTESVVLPARLSDATSSAFTSWPFMSVHFWGENPAGRWKFEVSNGGQAGKILLYQLVLYGVAVDAYDKNRPEVPTEIHCHETCDNTNPSSPGCFGSGPDQCKKCQPSLFKVDDTNLCVSHCDDGYYADTHEHKCNLCSKTCATCTGVDMCTSCVDNLFLDPNGHCVVDCPQGYFTDETLHKCMPCKENCTSCNSSQDCLHCLEGFDVFSGTCKLKCKARQYRNMAGDCTACEDENCALCSEANKCNICDITFFLYHGDCIDKCNSHTYQVKLSRDSAQLECHDCDDQCATCNEGMNNNCLSCHDGDQLTPMNTCVANKSCNAGQFRSLGGGDCKPCHYSCFSCNGQTAEECTSCANDTYLKDGVCVQDCGQGLYKHTSEDGHPSCQRCDQSCSQCDGPGADDCTVCNDNAFLEDKKCNRVCPTGQYLKESDSEQFSPSMAVCANCSQHCLACSGPDVYDCTSCGDNMALSDDGQCVTDCAAGFFKQGVAMEGLINFVCSACNTQCQTCSGALSTDCLSCSSDLLLFQGQCVSKASCYPNQFYNSTANECLSCHTSCVNCTGASEVECTGCGANQDLYVPPNSNTRLTSDFVREGRCVLCCQGESAKSGVCCDCRKKGSPKCEETDEFATTVTLVTIDSHGGPGNLLIIVALGAFSAIFLYIVIFFVLQYRSNGRCSWQTSSSTLFVDGNGVVEYSSLTNKDLDLAHMDDQVHYSKNKVLGYNSD